jgi:outer membrane protein assembly factor BamD
VKNKKFWKILCTAVLLSGCGSNNSVYVEKPVQDLYQSAMQLMKGRDYQKAADAFDEVDRQHPYSDCASKAQLLSGFCAFKAQKFPRAIATLDVFIDLHPGSASIAYAYYLRAMCYYTDMLGLTKDKENAQLALEAFREILRRFPTSEYAHDARIRQDFICEHLASHDMLVAKQYLFDQRYVAAWIRFGALLTAWPRSILIPEVLYRLVECQVALGMGAVSDKAVAMLRYNFPKSSWTNRAHTLIEKTKTLESKKCPR